MEEADHNRSARIHFYQMGLWNKNGFLFLDKKRPEVAWKVLTLKKIRQRIGMLRSLERDHGMIPFDYKSNLKSKGFVQTAPDKYSCAEIVYFNSKFKI